MAKTILVETDKEAGAKLLSLLDDAEFKVQAALWFYSADSEEWRLIFASSLVDEEGPKATYEKVQSVLKKSLLEESYKISLQDISIVSPESTLIKLLRKAIKTGPNDISDITFSRNVINNVFIQDAYIYRVS